MFRRRLSRCASIAGMLACALACGAARAADVPDIPAPLATVSAPTVPVADSVPGGDKVERVQVTDAFIELHTFPGRGYPVFYVAGRGEWVSIELRHTDWYKVRTATGKVGWVTRAQLQTTLAESGLETRFGDVAFDDYLARRVELGAGYGRFHQEPMIKFWLSYRISDTLSFESTLGQVQGVFSGSTLWHVNLQAEPWSDQRFSPFAGVGIGQFKNTPEPEPGELPDHQRAPGGRHRRRALPPHRSLHDPGRLRDLHRVRVRTALARVPRGHRRSLLLLLMRRP